jgi:hypothetical protein
MPQRVSIGPAFHLRLSVVCRVVLLRNVASQRWFTREKRDQPSQPKSEDGEDTRGHTMGMEGIGIEKG